MLKFVKLMSNENCKMVKKNPAIFVFEAFQIYNVNLLI